MIEAVRLFLKEPNTLFDDMVKKLCDYPEMKNMLHDILFRGVRYSFEIDNPNINIGVMFGFVKESQNAVVIANRLFETKLYNLFLSQAELEGSQSGDLMNARNQFVVHGMKGGKDMKRKRLIAAAAVCFVLAFTAGTLAVKYRSSQIKLSDSSVHVTARYTEYDPKSEACERLVPLTEEELFSEDNTAVFKGTVSEIRNVELRFNRAKSYCAIAEIKVEKVYRGSCGVDSTVAVMIPTGHIDVNAQPKKTLLGTVSAMRVGMTGIFMPDVYDENSVWEENDAKLNMRDLAEYGFGDCTRFAFLETKKGLLFDRNTYESMADAEELGEIEEYVQDMIRKTS